MDFPMYVPEAARSKLAHYLEGETKGSIPGYLDLLSRSEAKLAEIEHKKKESLSWLGVTPNLESQYRDDLRKKEAAEIEHRDKLANGVACLKQLSFDPRMRDAYDILNHEFTNDAQWGDFVFCAWVARTDYAAFRERFKRAKELKIEIANAATRLADLLGKFSENGVTAPDEFYSIPTLLRQTRNLDPLWPAMSRHVFGDLPEALAENAASDSPRDASAASNKQPEPPVVVRHIIGRGEAALTNVDEAEKERGMLRYAWSKAPDLTDVLRTVANAARDFNPEATDWIGAAIDSRKHNEKTEYLRAFAALLCCRRPQIDQ